MSVNEFVSHTTPGGGYRGTFRVKGRGESLLGFEISELGLFVGYEFSGVLFKAS